MAPLLHRAAIKKKEEEGRRNRMKIYMVSLFHRATIITKQTERQRSDSIGRTVLQTVAQKQTERKGHGRPWQLAYMSALKLICKFNR